MLRYRQVLLLLTLFSVNVSTSHADNNNSQQVRKMLKEKTIELCLEQDTFAAIEFLSLQKVELTVIKTYGDVMHHFYWKNKDLENSVAMGRAGLQYGLTNAAQCKDSDSERAAELKSAAKALAYDIASFTWDGWGEPGIAIAPSDLKIGLDAAQTNLRLAIELQKPDLPMSRAYWMLAGHQLSAKQFEPARKSYEEAAKLAQKANVPVEELLAIAFARLVDLIESNGKNGEPELQQAIDNLAAAEGGTDFVPQVETARSVFLNAPDKNK